MIGTNCNKIEVSELKTWVLKLGISFITLWFLISPEAFSAINSNELAGANQEAPSYNKNFFQLKMGVPIHSISIQKNAKDYLTYNPNNGFNLGFEYGLNGYRFGFEIPIPHTKNELQRKGHTDQYNLFTSSGVESWSWDIFFQKYKGFYLQEDNVGNNSIYRQRPDLGSIFYGGNLFYNIGSKKEFFSPVDFGEYFNKNFFFQGGTIILHMGFSDLTIRADHVFTTESDGIKEIRIRSLILGGGYVYKIKLDEQSLFRGHFVFGFGPQNQTQDFIQLSDTKSSQRNSNSYGIIGTFVSLDGTYLIKIKKSLVWFLNKDPNYNNLISSTGDSPWVLGISMKLNTLQSRIANSSNTLKVGVTGGEIKFFGNYHF